MSAPEKVPCDQCAASTPPNDLERCGACGAYVCAECMGADETCKGCTSTPKAKR